MTKVQRTVIVSVTGGVVQDIATDLDTEAVRFILVDFDVDGDDETEKIVRISGAGCDEHSDPAYVEDFNTSPLTIYSAADRRVMRIDGCKTDGQAQAKHEHGVSDCRSPQLWRRRVVDDLTEDSDHDFEFDPVCCTRCGMDDNEAEFQPCPGKQAVT